MLDTDFRLNLIYSLDNTFDFNNPIVIPPDEEAESDKFSSKDRAKANLSECESQKRLLDTFTVDHLLCKLKSDDIRIYPCYAPQDHDLLPFFARYVKPLHKESTIIVPFCDGSHFQGYVINQHLKKIVHVDSFSSQNPQNETSVRLKDIIFGKHTSAHFESLYSSRKQFDSNSCGAWLISGIYSYLNPSIDVRDRRKAFKICYELLNSGFSELSPVDHPSHKHENENPLHNPESFNQPSHKVHSFSCRYPKKLLYFSRFNNPDERYCINVWRIWLSSMR